MMLRHKQIGRTGIAHRNNHSGIGFLLGWHSFNLIVLVALFLIVAAGLWLGSRVIFKELPKSSLNERYDVHRSASFLLRLEA